TSLVLSFRYSPPPCATLFPYTTLFRSSSLDDGGISGLFSGGGPSVRFLTRYDGEVSEPLVGRQGSRVSMRVARGSASLPPSHGRSEEHTSELQSRFDLVCRLLREKKHA